MNPLQEIGSFGQSVWLDFISRKAIQDGTLQDYIDNGVVGMTSNPAIFEKAMAGSDYDEEITKLAKAGKTADQIYQQLAVEDVQSAADLLLPIFEKSHGQDGFISLEVSPLLAKNTVMTIQEAKFYWEWLNKPNVMIKIPATKEGLPAIEEAIASGLNVNVTLLFSVQRYKEVAAAYINGLERLEKAGGDLSKTRSVASFFLSRIDTLIDGDLDKIGTPEAIALKGKAAIASAKQAYKAFEEMFSGPRWEALHAKGANPQRLLWASTSTKNPAYKDTMYVEPLIGPLTVNTMPEDTIKAYIDHGQPSDQIRRDLGEADKDLHGLKELGIDILQAAEQLEHEGLVKFVEPFQKLAGVLESKRSQATAGAGVSN